MPCRALEAFRLSSPAWKFGVNGGMSLNALSGIGGVQTLLPPPARNGPGGRVLMPCRALEAFRRKCGYPIWEDVLE